MRMLVVSVGAARQDHPVSHKRRRTRLLPDATASSMGPAIIDFALKDYCSHGRISKYLNDRFDGRCIEKHGDRLE
jgi:hypothetical protein